MNKRIVISIISLLFLATFTGLAQDPISWNFSIEDAGSGVVDIVARATVDQGWYMYDTEIPDGGPNPTMIEFDQVTGGEVVGNFKASDKKAVVKFDEVFQMEIGTFTNSVTLKQRIKITDKNNFTAIGNVRAQACNDATCTPPLPVDFDFGSKNLPATLVVLASNKAESSILGENNITPINIENNISGDNNVTTTTNIKPVDSDL